MLVKFSFFSKFGKLFGSLFSKLNSVYFPSFKFSLFRNSKRQNGRHLPAPVPCTRFPLQIDYPYGIRLTPLHAIDTEVSLYCKTLCYLEYLPNKSALKILLFGKKKFACSRCLQDLEKLSFQKVFETFFICAFVQSSKVHFS